MTTEFMNDLNNYELLEKYKLLYEDYKEIKEQYRYLRTGIYHIKIKTDSHILKIDEIPRHILSILGASPNSYLTVDWNSCCVDRFHLHLRTTRRITIDAKEKIFSCWEQSGMCDDSYANLEGRTIFTINKQTKKIKDAINWLNADTREN